MRAVRLGIVVWIVVFYIALGLVIAHAAGAAQLVGPGAPWAYTVQTHVPGPPGPPIRVEVGPCPDLPSAGGCFYPGAPDGTGAAIYVLYPGDAFALEHELGHAFDSRALDDGERAWFVAVLGFPSGTPWRNPSRWEGGDPYCLRSTCPDERFADAYAVCALDLYTGHYDRRSGAFTAHAHGREVETIMAGGWRPSRRTRLDVCGAIWTASRPASDPLPEVHT